MTDTAPRRNLATHEVENQPTARGARDLWGEDKVLAHWATWAGARVDHCAAAGVSFGSEEASQDAADAQRDKPRLKLFDRSGGRLDEVEFHPGYHNLMARGMQAGYANAAWDGKPGGHATHAALGYMLHQTEPGVCCPLTMTYAVIPALQTNPALAAEWVPKLLSDTYDPSVRPIGQKFGATMGMAMTEKQGGSDVRANSTRATPDGDGWRLNGHKWFCSAPMCDGFLTLAHTEAGLSCFLVPRWLEEGRNSLQIQRLKDKLGNHANASSEIEYHDTKAYLLGEEGRGVNTIIEMVHHTRLDTALAPAGLMRAALAEAKWWVEGRRTFQRRLIDQPMMRSVLADLALEHEAATALAFTAAKSFDGVGDEDRSFARISVALAKFLNNKRVVPVVVEAMEVLGGMGYVEETPMPMFYREAPLNGIWEGSGNVICLDIMRSLARDPLAGDVLSRALQAPRGADRRYDAALARYQDRWPQELSEANARWFAEETAVLLAASSLIQHGEAAVADAFVATRLVPGGKGQVFGAIDGIDQQALLDRL